MYLDCERVEYPNDYESYLNKSPDLHPYQRVSEWCILSSWNSVNDNLLKPCKP